MMSLEEVLEFVKILIDLFLFLKNLENPKLVIILTILISILATFYWWFTRQQQQQQQQ